MASNSIWMNADFLNEAIVPSPKVENAFFYYSTSPITRTVLNGGVQTFITDGQTQKNVSMAA